jgi:hypothetical protein
MAQDSKRCGEAQARLYMVAREERSVVMKVSEAVLSRRSMRVFKPDAVPRATDEWVIETANRAASNGNL